MTVAMEDLGGDVRNLVGKVIPALEERGKRNRTLIRRGYLYLTLDILLTIAFSIAIGFAVNADHRAAQATAAAAVAKAAAAEARQVEISSCQTGNDARVKQIVIWDHLLALPRVPGSPPRTKAQQKQAGDFAKYIHQTFAPRDCSALARGKGR